MERPSLAAGSLCHSWKFLQHQWEKQMLELLGLAASISVYFPPHHAWCGSFTRTWGLQVPYKALLAEMGSQRQLSRLDTQKPATAQHGQQASCKQMRYNNLLTQKKGRTDEKKTQWALLLAMLIPKASCCLLLVVQREGCPAHQDGQALLVTAAKRQGGWGAKRETICYQAGVRNPRKGQ